MPGIVVGVDGSSHSRMALERAAAEAAAHGAALTVLTVHQAVRDVYGSVSHYQDDAALTSKAKEAAQAETDQVLAAVGSQPASVTVTAVPSRPARSTACRVTSSSRGRPCGVSRRSSGSVSSIRPRW